MQRVNGFPCFKNQVMKAENYMQMRGHDWAHAALLSLVAIK